MNTEPVPSPFFNKKTPAKVIVITLKNEGKEIITDIFNMNKAESDAVLLTIAKSIVDAQKSL